MHTRLFRSTYEVAFTDQDARIFSRETDAPEGVVQGHGSFVFDSATGEIVGASGSARGRGEIEWLAFSQDAQDFGRGQLAGAGVQVNPFDFATRMPELYAGDCPETGHRVVFGGSSFLRPTPSVGEAGTVLGRLDEGVLVVEWDRHGIEALLVGTDGYGPVTNPARISRTRGTKGRGPYSARRGYKAWIQHQGTLGEGFLTTMSKKQREQALDACVGSYGYRSCIGKIMALERAKTGPYGTGVGVGKKYAGKLESSRDYLRRTYGGAGSFGPRRKGERDELASHAAEAGAGYGSYANPPAGLDTSAHPKSWAALGGFLGSSVGMIPGMALMSAGPVGAAVGVGLLGVGSAVGGFAGARYMAPQDRAANAGLGGGIGGLFFPVGAAIGGAIGAARPDQD